MKNVETVRKEIFSDDMWNFINAYLVIIKYAKAVSEKEKFLANGDDGVLLHTALYCSKTSNIALTEEQIELIELIEKAAKRLVDEHVFKSVSEGKRIFSLPFTNRELAEALLERPRVEQMFDAIADVARERHDTLSNIFA